MASTDTGTIPSTTLGAECCNPGINAGKSVHNPHPGGREVQIAGIDCYSVGDSSSAVVLISTDVFGHRFPDVQLIANELAAAGFHVVIPDLFDHDAMTVERLSLPNGEGVKYLSTVWWPKHQSEAAADVLVKVGHQLKQDGTASSIQIVAYCYGALGVLRMYSEGLASSGVVSHPTGFTKDNVGLCTAPTAFLCAEFDHRFPSEIRQHWERTLKEKQVPAVFVDFPGMSHGFAVRELGPKAGTPEAAAARQRATQETIRFLKQQGAAH